MNVNRMRLAKIAGLLFSDQDGEVVAAARMIRRMVSAHDFMGMVEGPPPQLQIVEVDRIRLNEIVEMADAILANNDMMAKHERRFVRSMRAAAMGQPDFEMTQKQAQWFASLYTKYSDDEA